MKRQIPQDTTRREVPTGEYVSDYDCELAFQFILTDSEYSKRFFWLVGRSVYVLRQCAPTDIKFAAFYVNPL